MNTETPNIWLLQSQRDVEGLTLALDHADPETRRLAVTALHILDAGEVVPALEAALAVEDDWVVQETITAAIKHLTRQNRMQELISRRDIDGLISMLYSPRLEDVLSAADALGELGDQTTVETLVDLFGTPGMPDDVRYAIAQALIRLKAAPASVTLLAVLERDEWPARQNAAAVLGQLKASWATRGLVHLLHDPVREVRQSALKALQSIGTPIALQAVSDAISHGERLDPDEDEESFSDESL